MGRCHLRSSFPLPSLLPSSFYRSTFPANTHVPDILRRQIHRRSQGLALWSERPLAILAVYLFQDGSVGFFQTEVPAADCARDGAVAAIPGMSVQP